MKLPWLERRSRPNRGRSHQMPTAYEGSRHAEVTRRAALRYGAAVTAGAVLVACGDDAALVRDESISIDPTPSPATSPGTAPATTAAPDTTVPPTAAPTTAPPETAPPETVPPETVPPETVTEPAANLALAPGADMLVSFTYEQAPGGKDELPYTAVWIEDADGALVHTIALWILQGNKGRRWLSDLSRWFSVDNAAGGGSADVVSSPTRVPGNYTLVWDGQVSGVGPLPTGDYYICIESVRERGPYSLIRQPLRLAGQPLALALPDEGELVAASVAVA